MSECDGGLPPASPIAVPTRAAKSIGKFTAMPQSAVMALQVATASASTFMRLHRSASAAIGNAEERIEERERNAAQHAELKVGRAELLLDRLERRREDLRPIHHVDDVADCQRQQDIAPVPGLAQQPFASRGGGGPGDGGGVDTGDSLR